MKSKYANLDLLRAMAVLSVVIAHLWYVSVAFHLCAENEAVSQFVHNLSITGVTFFFVHTCLVLMLSMHRTPDAHRGRSFLIRRAFRIYPLCWAAILLALVTGFTDLPLDELRHLSPVQIASGFLLVQNLLPHRIAVNILGPLWSLPWEVQMYLVLPLFFLFLRRYDSMRTVLALWLGAALLAVVGTQPSVAHFGWTIFPPMFISGMVAYRLLSIRSTQGAAPVLPAFVWPLLILCLFVAQPLLVGGSVLFSSRSAAVNACNCLLVGLAVPFFGELKAGWIVKPAEQIAKYSYGVYLLHIPAIFFVFRCFPGWPGAMKIAASLFLTALLPIASFHGIEDPLIQLGKRLTRPKAPARAATPLPTTPDFDKAGAPPCG